MQGAITYIDRCGMVSESISTKILAGSSHLICNQRCGIGFFSQSKAANPPSANA